MNIKFDVLISIISGYKLCDDKSWIELQNAENYLLSNLNTNIMDEECVDIYSPKLRNIISNYLLECYPKFETIIFLLEDLEPDNKFRFMEQLKRNLDGEYPIAPIPVEKFKKEKNKCA